MLIILTKKTTLLQHISNVNVSIIKCFILCKGFSTYPIILKKLVANGFWNILFYVLESQQSVSTTLSTFFALTPAELIKSWYAACVLLLYWPFLNNWILLLLKLSSCSFSNSFSFSRNLTCSCKCSNFCNNEGSDSFYFCFISRQLSRSCIVITKLCLESHVLQYIFAILLLFL